MRKLLILGVSMLASPILAAPRIPPQELLGLTLGMPDHEIRGRLGRLGKLSETQPEGAVASRSGICAIVARLPHGCAGGPSPFS